MVKAQGPELGVATAGTDGTDSHVGRQLCVGRRAAQLKPEEQQ